MRFFDVISDIDESHTSLGESLVPQSKKRKSSAKEDERTAKAELWKALTTQLSQGSSLNSHTETILMLSKVQRSKRIGRMFLVAQLQTACFSVIQRTGLD